MLLLLLKCHCKQFGLKTNIYSGVGFTVIVKLCVVPLQVSPNIRIAGRYIDRATTGDVPEFIAINKDTIPTTCR